MTAPAGIRQETEGSGERLVGCRMGRFAGVAQGNEAPVVDRVKKIHLSLASAPGQQRVELASEYRQQMTHTCANRSAKCGSALKARIRIMDGRVAPEGTLPDWRRAKNSVACHSAGCLRPELQSNQNALGAGFRRDDMEKSGKPCGMQAERLCLCLQKETPWRRARAFELPSFGRVRRRLRFRRS
jgi:hypothetical protein